MTLLNLQRSPAAFRDALLIDTDNGTRPFSSVMDDWQREDFAALDPGFIACTGQTPPPGSTVLSRAWLERARGHSKTLDQAVMSLWALFASKKRLSGLGAAVDLDQSRLLRDACSKLLQLNPWLASILEVQNTRIINKHTESTLELIAHDVAGSWGTTPDFVIADECCHWPKQDLFTSLLSSAAKRSRSMFVTITNAGITDDWCWNLREKVRVDPSWYFHRLEGSCASWISKDTLQEQERLLPTMAYARLWLNAWSTGGGDALRAEDIEAAFKPNLKPMTGKVPGYIYVAGLDLGVSRDASALVVLGINRANRSTTDTHGRIRLVHTELWRPSKTSRVNLQDVEDRILVLHQRYKFASVAYDPWESRHMSARLSLAKIPMQEVTQQGGNLQKIATTVIEAFSDRRIDLYEHVDLHRDLRRLRVEERAYGFRLTSPHDEHGHGDTASAFGFAMLAAADIAGTPRAVAGNNLFSPQGCSALEQAINRVEYANYHEQMVQKYGNVEPFPFRLNRR